MHTVVHEKAVVISIKREEGGGRAKEGEDGGGNSGAM